MPSQSAICAISSTIPDAPAPMIGLSVPDRANSQRAAPTSTAASGESLIAAVLGWRTSGAAARLGARIGVVISVPPTASFAGCRHKRVCERGLIAFWGGHQKALLSIVLGT